MQKSKLQGNDEDPTAQQQGAGPESADFGNLVSR